MTKQHHSFGLLVVSFIVGSSTAYSATTINLRHQSLSTLPAFIASPKSKTDLSEMKMLKRDVDFNHTTHIKMQQTYNNYPVWGANAIAHVSAQHGTANKSINPLLSSLPSTKMNGVVYKDLDKDLSYAPPFIFNAQQSQKAHDFLVNQHLSSFRKNNIKQTDNKMIVYIHEGKARWAYKINFIIAAPHSMIKRPTFILDALTFDVYKHWDEIQTITAQDEPKPGDQPNQPQPTELEEVKGGGFGGNLNGLFIYDGQKGNKLFLSIKRDSNKKLCYLMNDIATIKYYNFDSTTWSYIGEPIQYQCDALDPKHGNIYWNGMFDATPTFGVSPANDALYAAEWVNEVYQYLYDQPVLNNETIEPSFDDQQESNRRMININLHPSDITNNAYYDPVANELVIGDGDGKEFYPLASIDVIAHELSHGFTHQHAGLINDGQSAGLNESFSDMASQVTIALEEKLKPNRITWKIGTNVIVSNKNGKKALRYMDNPRRDCVGVAKDQMCSIDHMKNYYDGLDGHFSSGIFNKAFYLLSTSPNWDIKKAFDVMIQANMRYWLPNSDFAEAACGVLDAAKDYGYDLDTIRKAFSGVGIETDKC